MTKWIPARAVVLLAACIALLPAARAAPPGHTVRVGVLFPIAPSFDPAVSPVARELFDGLRELGYTPGQDIAFEFRSAEGNAEALPRLANELVALKPDLLLITGTEAVLSAAEIIKTIPVVIVGTADVVDSSRASRIRAGTLPDLRSTPRKSRQSACSCCKRPCRGSRRWRCCGTAASNR
jgi:ABC-type uncharacterized transport system substrate-binding protein